MKCYDRDRAIKLVPLLESIMREVADRQRKILILEKRMNGLTEFPADEAMHLELLAQLAAQRRQVRLSKKEIECLGCVVDKDQPNRVFIPGHDGNIDHGFRWDSGDPTVHRTTSDSHAK